MTDWVNFPEQATDKLSREITDEQPKITVKKITTEIVEAQEWIVDTNGNVILVAQSPLQNSSIPSGISCVDVSHLRKDSLPQE